MTNDTKKQLIKACIDGNLEEVNRLIAEGVNPNASDQKLSTALIKAAEKGHAEIARNLLWVGANPDVVNYDHYTALMYAAQNGHAEVTKLLLSERVNLNVVSKHDKTALCLANDQWLKTKTQEEALKYKRIVEMLKTAGAKNSADYPKSEKS